MMDLPCVDVACVVEWLSTEQHHKTKRHLVRYPPQFNTHHPSTQATSIQGKCIILDNSVYFINP